MTSKVVLCVAAYCLLFCSQAHAEDLSVPYETLVAESDTVVIAVTNASRDADKVGENREYGRTVLVETDFTILSVLKGDDSLRHATLEHMRREDANAILPDDTFVDFPAKNQEIAKSVLGTIVRSGRRREYLLFLKQCGNGNYMPAAGPMLTKQSVRVVEECVN